MYQFILTGIPIRLYAQIRFSSQIKISYLLYACHCTSLQAKDLRPSLFLYKLDCKPFASEDVRCRNDEFILVRPFCHYC